MPYVKGHNKPGPGRPKGSLSLTTKLKQYLTDHPDKLRAIIEATVNDALAGDVQARKLVFDRVDGGVPQRLTVAQLSEDQLLELLMVEDNDAVESESE